MPGGGAARCGGVCWWLAFEIGRSGVVVVRSFALGRLATGRAAIAEQAVWWEIAAARVEFWPRARGIFSLPPWGARVRPDPVGERAVVAVVCVVRVAGRRWRRRWVRGEARGIPLPSQPHRLVTSVAAVAAMPIQLLMPLPGAVEVARPRLVRWASACALVILKAAAEAVAAVGRHVVVATDPLGLRKVVGALDLAAVAAPAWQLLGV